MLIGPHPEPTGKSPALGENAISGKRLALLAVGLKSDRDKFAQALFDNALAQARYQGMRRGENERGDCVASTEGGRRRCLLGASCEDAREDYVTSVQWRIFRGTAGGDALLHLHDSKLKGELLTELDFFRFAADRGLIYTEPEVAKREGYPTAPLVKS